MVRSLRDPRLGRTEKATMFTCSPEEQNATPARKPQKTLRRRRVPVSVCPLFRTDILFTKHPCAAANWRWMKIRQSRSVEAVAVLFTACLRRMPLVTAVVGQRDAC